MKRRIWTTLILLLSASAGGQTPLERPAFSKLGPEAQARVQTWLNKNCGAGEQGAFEKKLIEFGVVLEPVFWEAFRLGPTEGELKSASTAVATRPEMAQGIW